MKGVLRVSVVSDNAGWLPLPVSVACAYGSATATEVFFATGGGHVMENFGWLKSGQGGCVGIS